MGEPSRRIVMGRKIFFSFWQDPSNASCLPVGKEFTDLFVQHMLLNAEGEMHVGAFQGFLYECWVSLGEGIKSLALSLI